MRKNAITFNCLLILAESWRAAATACAGKGRPNLKSSAPPRVLRVSAVNVLSLYSPQRRRERRDFAEKNEIKSLPGTGKALGYAKMDVRAPRETGRSTISQAARFLSREDVNVACKRWPLRSAFTRPRMGMPSRA